MIAAALSAHPELLRLPRLARSREPGAEVRKSLSVMVVPRTNLIRVSMPSESADEAAQIVNAVIEAFLEVALDTDEQEAEQRCRRLREVKEERAVAVRQERDAIAQLVRRVGSVDAHQARDRNSVTIEAYRGLTQQLLQVDLELVEAQASSTSSSPGRPGRPGRAGRRRPSPRRPIPRRSPPSTPTRRWPRSSRGWPRPGRRWPRPGGSPGTPQPASGGRPEAGRGPPGSGRRPRARMGPALVRSGRDVGTRQGEARAAELRVGVLKARLSQLNDRLEKLNIQTRAAGADELTLEFARQDLARADAVLDAVTRSLDRVEFEARGPAARFHQEYKARASNLPEVNHRIEAMAAAPVGVCIGPGGLHAVSSVGPGGRPGGRPGDAPAERPGRDPAAAEARAAGVRPTAGARPGPAATSTSSCRAWTTSGWRSARAGTPGAGPGGASSSPAPPGARGRPPWPPSSPSVASMPAWQPS